MLIYRKVVTSLSIAFILLLLAPAGCSTSSAIMQAGLQDHLFTIRDHQIADYLKSRNLPADPVVTYAAGKFMVAGYVAPQIAVISLDKPTAPRVVSVSNDSREYYLDEKGDVLAWKSWGGYQRYMEIPPDGRPAVVSVDEKSGRVLITTYKEFSVTTLARA